MIRRLFWIGLGAAVGIVVVRQVTKTAQRTAQAFTPSGIAGSVRQSAAGVGDGVRGFFADIRAGMQEREAEIDTALAEGRPVQLTDE